MMISSLIFAAVVNPTVKLDPLVCPVMNDGASNTKGVFKDFNGARYWFCCPGCDTTFEDKPFDVYGKIQKGKTSGMFMFDPVSKKRLKKAATSDMYLDYKGVRFPFSSKENMETFKANPAKFGEMPKKEALFCPVMKKPVASYAAADAYVDFNGVRYYICCGMCYNPLTNDPAKFASNSKAHVKTPGIANEIIKK